MKEKFNPLFVSAGDKENPSSLISPISLSSKSPEDEKKALFEHMASFSKAPERHISSF